jgi:cytochrome P450
MSQMHEGTLSVADIIQHLENPYPLYHQLRANDPVYWDERANSWVLTRYADVAAALRDPRYTVMVFMLWTASSSIAGHHISAACSTAAISVLKEYSRPSPRSRTSWTISVRSSMHGVPLLKMT